ELYKGGWFFGNVCIGIKRVVPGEGKEPFRLHFLHDGLPFEVLVARIGHLATRDLAGYERPIQFHAKPIAELPVIRQRAPDARNGRLQFNALLNTVVHLKQPPGCILAWPVEKRNLLVALSGSAGEGSTIICFTTKSTFHRIAPM